MSDSASPRLKDQAGSIRMATTLEVRTDPDGRKTLRGVFTPFNEWTRIASWEGDFRERSIPGAFKRTISQSWDSFKKHGRHSIVVNYNHGFDPQIADRQLGQIRVLEERDEGPYYEVSLLNTEYNRDYIVPAAEDGLLGASFRFAVPKGGDEWNEKTDDGVPERTLKDVAVFEFGPVDHPAYAAATAGVRTASEFQWWRNLDEEGRTQYATLIRRAHDLGTPEPSGSATTADPDPAPGTSDEAPASPPTEAPVESNAPAEKVAERHRKAERLRADIERVLVANGLDTKE